MVFITVGSYIWAANAYGLSPLEVGEASEAVRGAVLKEFFAYFLLYNGILAVVLWARKPAGKK